MKKRQNFTPNFPPPGDVTKETETLLASDGTDMVWPDTICLADDGFLYVSANRLPFFTNGLMSDETGPNFRCHYFILDGKFFEGKNLRYLPFISGLSGLTLGETRTTSSLDNYILYNS